MTSTVWFKRDDNGRYHPGDCVDVMPGDDRPHGKAPTQSAGWRVVIVRDASPEQIKALGLLDSVIGADKVLLQRGVYVDIAALEALEESRRHRKLASDDVLDHIYLEDLARLLRHKAAPQIPGVIG